MSCISFNLYFCYNKSHISVILPGGGKIGDEMNILEWEWMVQKVGPVMILHLPWFKQQHTDIFVSAYKWFPAWFEHERGMKLFSH